MRGRCRGYCAPEDRDASPSAYPVHRAAGRRVRAGGHAPRWHARRDGATPDTATWTVLRAIDPQSGTTLRQTARLDGRYDLPFGGIGLAVAGLSPDGRWLALQVNRTEREDRAAQRQNRWKSQLMVV